MDYEKSFIIFIKLLSTKLYNLVRKIRTPVLLYIIGTTACLAEVLVALYIVLWIAGLIIYHFVQDNMIWLDAIGRVYVGQTIKVHFSYNNEVAGRGIDFKIEKLNTEIGEWIIKKHNWYDAEVGRHFSIDVYWTSDETGDYRAEARFVDPEGPKAVGRHAATEYFVVEAGGGAQPLYELRIWCGNETKGNPGERLNNPFAHPATVEIIDPQTQQGHFKDCQ